MRDDAFRLPVISGLLVQIREPCLHALLLVQRKLVGPLLSEGRPSMQVFLFVEESADVEEDKKAVAECVLWLSVS